MVKIAPLKGNSIEKPWEGNCNIKPWDYDVTVAIPFINTIDTLNICLELIKLQTINTFIIVIDTGSSEDLLDKVFAMRCENLEVHSLRLNGVMHPSDFASYAMDVAFSVCRTPYLFATHADCFLRKRNFLEYLMKMCNKKNPVVGYQMTPRSHSDWEWMVSHTASMYHMPTMDRIGFSWSMRRLCRSFGIKDQYPDPNRPTWPDADYMGNYILRKNNIKPQFIGTEDNFCRNKDEYIDHIRAVASGRLYSEDYALESEKWVEEAIREATQRIENWKLGID